MSTAITSGENNDIINNCITFIKIIFRISHIQKFNLRKFRIFKNNIIENFKIFEGFIKF